MALADDLLSGKNSTLFVLLAGYTDISMVNGISSAGASPDMMKLTPVLDSEIIAAGRTISTNEPPMTPDGIPTPSIITRAALNVSGLNVLIVDAGFRVFPAVPFMYTGLGGARNPVSVDALQHAEKASEYGRIIGKYLDRSYSTLILAESVPGGTTTAYLTLRSGGLSLETSSSMPGDPHDLKEEIFRKSGSLMISSPGERIKKYGDYMMALSVSISSEFSGTIIYGGGTQMGNVYDLDRRINGYNDRRYVSTTSWVMKHRPGTMHALVPDDKLLVADLDFSGMGRAGLRKYEDGNVREGAGMGASSYYALLDHPEDDLYAEIERNYEKFSTRK